MQLPLGPPVLIRPVRPDDEAALCAMVERLTPSDARFRFFVPLTRLPRPLAVRLTNIDYDREMAFVAIAASDFAASVRRGDMLGMTGLVADSECHGAEIAVLVRSDVKKRRLGSVLMRRLIEYAVGRNISVLHGSVLRDNEGMIGLCRSLGFSLETDPHEPSAYRTTFRVFRGAGPSRGSEGDDLNG